MNGRYTRRIPPSSVITDSGVDHVRLAYHYLDNGDLDGYGSLLHAGPLGPDLEGPGARGARHDIIRIVAEGDCVVAMGRLSPQQRDFVDVFTLSDEGMLRACRRYYSALPR
ncbi:MULTISPECIES: nuclear transport factor 2 family protein [Streptomyces]|uniref:nuclear transport factor 2 family protein n=1 Tax=Streptomyces TaxID=1883 RepID=UPI002271FEDA|nr:MULTISPECIES: nuclear transport factor 2 family protein [unclassified Streptomyces]MCY0944326.1 nuclear transport factor 2 family protein [Streptomyces sp. H34-AA3]MCY0954424.1 nuclear transport factor 2 family protein [Streptomyces sp. H27-S2]MCZ4086629.1 nuclear transport factor 2 family protein [Streptomyces sp. H34-S5]